MTAEPIFVPRSAPSAFAGVLVEVATFLGHLALFALIIAGVFGAAALICWALVALGIVR